MERQVLTDQIQVTAPYDILKFQSNLFDSFEIVYPTYRNFPLINWILLKNQS
jgi:hypothetical protein